MERFQFVAALLLAVRHERAQLQWKRVWPCTAATCDRQAADHAQQLEGKGGVLPRCYCNPVVQTHTNSRAERGAGWLQFKTCSRNLPESAKKQETFLPLHCLRRLSKIRKSRLMVMPHSATQ